MTARTRHYLVTPAGVGNYGDELIAKMWLRHLAKVAPDAEVVIDCAGPDVVARRLQGIHPRVRFVATLWRLCAFMCMDKNVEESVAFVERSVADPASVPDLTEGIEELRRADTIHIVGGGFINSHFARLLSMLAAAPAAAAHSGALTAFTGQGLWPLAPGTEDLARRLISRFGIADVRDSVTYDFLKGIDAAVQSPDDMFLNISPDLFRADADAPEVMVSLQTKFSEVDTSDLVDYVAGMVKAWGVDRVGLIESSPDFDKEVMELAEQRMPVARRYTMDELLESGLPAGPGQTWIATRFHPHLFAAARGASGVAVSIAPDYLGVKHRSLLECGSRWTLVEKLEGVPERPTQGGFTPVELEGLRVAKAKIADRIYPAS
ncbi:polysaccharide pyruvyl transferase family protein [Streptomyces sp. NBC_00448]|uniref:polysaccharide pyruvyl transferase family protein n=1 Tax=Streptomyces sp. NBC_00448 TaxID=2903652 RepID=UPI002E222F30